MPDGDKSPMSMETFLVIFIITVMILFYTYIVLGAGPTLCPNTAQGFEGGVELIAAEFYTDGTLVLTVSNREGSAIEIHRSEGVLSIAPGTTGRIESRESIPKGQEGDCTGGITVHLKFNLNGVSKTLTSEVSGVYESA